MSQFLTGATAAVRPVRGRASLALLVGVLLFAGCGSAAEDQVGEASPAPSLADLPVGRQPGLAYVVAGRSVVLDDRWVDLEWEVSDVGIGSREVLVYSAEDGTIYRVGRDGITPVSGDATSPPVFGGTSAWIENDREVVQQGYRDEARQPLPAGCCDGARVVGFDADMDPDIYVVAQEGAWLWDTYEGNEGSTHAAPDSTDHFWPVGDLLAGTVVETGAASEVLVKYPNHEWGWGYVDGPRDPSSDAPLSYREQKRTTAQGVWLTADGIVALDTAGRLGILESAYRNDDAGHHWRVLTGGVSALLLPTNLRVDGVVRERDHVVLIDATDDSGQRAWVRCDLRSLECEIAAELGPHDLTPK